MGGALGVESELGRGSTFTLVLPLMRPSTSGVPAGDGPCPAGEVFLILEANPLTQSVLKSVVAPLGLTPEPVTTLDAAAARLAAGGVAGVLVDAAGLGAETPERLAALARLVASGGAADRRHLACSRRGSHPEPPIRRCDPGDRQADLSRQAHGGPEGRP